MNTIASAAATSSLDADLASALGSERAEQWRLDRGPQHPIVRVERAGDRPVAAVITTRRSATAAVKIADTWRAPDSPDGDDALTRLIGEVIASARNEGLSAVKWESREDTPLPERFGFQRMRTPYRSAKGTEGVTGHILWLSPVPHEEPPYYAQTSTFTCGAVTALLASEIRGSSGFGSDEGNRDRELDFWRRASNYPSCEPIGLAEALRSSLDDPAGTAPVEVFLDTDGPALLETFPEGFERTFREELQANSLQRALASDIPVRRERITIDEVASRLRHGELALLLINLEPMFGFAVPHWVLAHAAADGVVLIDDPWIASSWGETWVDAHELPVTLAELDRMAAWGDDDYRGVIFIRRT